MPDSVNIFSRHQRKERTGEVVSSKMQKTIVVAIERRVAHPVYGKMMTRSKNIKAHDEENTAKAGDLVRIAETRPLSKDKRWRLVCGEQFRCRTWRVLVLCLRSQQQDVVEASVRRFPVSYLEQRGHSPRPPRPNAPNGDGTTIQ